MQLDKVISALRRCSEPSQILELEEKLNAIGLTVQQSQAGRIFLCRISEGRPACNDLFEDHVPICDFNGTLDDRAKMIALEFILSNVASPDRISHTGQEGNYGLYGTTLHDNLIKAISEWIE